VEVALLIMRVLLAVAFAASGLQKLALGKHLEDRMAWVAHYSAAAVRGIGGAEVAGALGLVLPLFTGIGPWLTATAAVGLVLLMVGAALTHLRLRENQMLPVNGVLAVLCGLVAVGSIAVG
jgi:uncharacterized membrane protein YphA (DoxX/SURF4 family)